MTSPPDSSSAVRASSRVIFSMSKNLIKDFDQLVSAIASSRTVDVVLKLAVVAVAVVFEASNATAAFSAASLAACEMRAIASTLRNLR